MTIAYIGMGGNLASPAGQPEATLAAAAVRMGALGRVAARSSLYRTAPVGYVNQPPFVNAVVGLATEMGPRKLLDGLMQIEDEFGRERLPGLRDGPRTLDLDLLFYGDVVFEGAGLTLPHPRLRERAFVLTPLGEIAPAPREPRTARTVAEMLESLVSPSGSANDAVVALKCEFWRAGVVR